MSFHITCMLGMDMEVDMYVIAVMASQLSFMPLISLSLFSVCFFSSIASQLLYIRT